MVLNDILVVILSFILFKTPDVGEANPTTP